jgi:uncharacterized protein
MNNININSENIYNTDIPKNNQKFTNSEKDSPLQTFEHRPFNPLEIKTRKINFHFDSSIPRLWLDNSLVMTHFFNGMNLFVPKFEAAMVQIMRKQLTNIQDPDLKQQTRGFIAQEMSHSLTHDKYNQILIFQGYSFSRYLKFADFIFTDVIVKTLPLKVGLATIAGFEHLTGMLADLVLNQNVMKDLWEWHAAEEVEHENIAFEVLQEVDNSYLLRILGLFLGALILNVFTFAGMFILGSQEANLFSRHILTDLNKLLFKENKLAVNGFLTFCRYFKFQNNPSHLNSVILAGQVLAVK